MTVSVSPISAVLFDLDGTLVDSAPDLIGALNRLRKTLGLEPSDDQSLRAVAGRGAVAILKTGLPELSDSEREAFRKQFLLDYQAHCWKQSYIFNAVPQVLEQIEQAGMKWGIVTNKLHYLAEPVVEQAGWQSRIACLIAGDTTANPKPAPDPVLAACEAMAIAPSKVLLIGDDLRDIQAGLAAGCMTAAAHWGYLSAHESAFDWPADVHFETTAQMLSWFQGR